MPSPIVHLYQSTQRAAPVLTGQAGSLTALLKACLVDGYGATTIASISRVNTDATVECIDHGYEAGDTVVISGATEAGFNGTVTVTSAPNTHAFVYTVVDTLPASASTATSISVKRAGAGWVYQANTANRDYFRIPNGAYLDVTDDGVTYGAATVAAAKGWREVGTQYASFMDFPRPGVVGFVKSSTADATAREWVIVASDSMMYLWVNYNSAADGGGGRLHAFGCLEGDGTKINGARPCTIFGNAYNGSGFSPNDLAYNYGPNLSENIFGDTLDGHWMDKVYRLNSQTAAAGECGKVSDWARTNRQTTMGMPPHTGIIYSPAEGSTLHMAPVIGYDNDTTPGYIYGPIGYPRGMFPGLWNPVDKFNYVPHGEKFGSMAGYLPLDSSRKFILLRMAAGSLDVAKAGCAVALEYSSTWIV